MTHVRTTAATLTAALALVLAPQVHEIAHATPIARVAATTPTEAALVPLATLDAVEVDDTEVIDGVRIVTDSDDRADLAAKSVAKFADAGFPITNTEVRLDETPCEEAVGFHTEERGHHVVVMCTDAEWTLLHELGHVWSDLYLGESQRAEWVTLRGLESWSEGDWSDRGTEHVADIIAFGLNDTLHVPNSIRVNDYRSVVSSFEWLFGMAPLHRTGVTTRPASLATPGRVVVVAPRTFAPSDAPIPNPPGGHTVEAAPASEYRFPLACGFPRWHSAHGGYGYTDPRDWTHVGVDLYAFEGTPVVSPAHGTVVESGWAAVGGWGVVVEDRFGYRHRMIHLARPPIVVEGMEVHAGQRLGVVGRSGNAAGGGPHLHYEIRAGDGTVDPMAWLNATGEGNVDTAPSSFSHTAAPIWSGCEAKA